MLRGIEQNADGVVIAAIAHVEVDCAAHYPENQRMAAVERIGHGGGAHHLLGDAFDGSDHLFLCLQRHKRIQSGREQ